MRKLIFSIGVVGLLFLALSAFGPGKASAGYFKDKAAVRKDASKGTSKTAKFEVNIDNFNFGPVDLKVPVGAKVTWTNHDDVPHTVVSTARLFASPVLDTGEQFSYTFTKSGEYGYFCSIHPKMTARVVVE